MRNGWITTSFGSKYHYINDKLHHDDGPALIYSSGHKQWYQNDRLHRLDGPAIEYTNDDNKQEWWYQGKYVNVSSQVEFERWLRLRIFL